jgi:hypothetical protein
MKRISRKFILDLLLSPLTLISALWLKHIRKNIVGYFSDTSSVSKKIFYKIGVFPILDHYYEPLFNPKRLRFSLRDDRKLAGIDWNIPEQLELLQAFNFNDEILEISKRPPDELAFSLANSSFGSGDADYLYNMVRFLKPKNVIEIGCGNSTLMMQHAMEANTMENRSYACNHICIEPYPSEWLGKLPVRLIRDFAEKTDPGVFKTLRENDILFIDSSHIIRPQGDVLFEYLELLPMLRPGVVVHVHDIFTPKDYLSEWFHIGKVFWNEQYLLEAFLTCNTSFKIIGALNFLMHNHYCELSAKAPLLTKEREPGSFWMKRAR